METIASIDSIDNLELEQKLIGKLLNDWSLFDDYEGILEVDLFTNSAYRQIFEAIAMVFKAHGKYDLFAVIDYLRKQQQLDSVGGSAGVTEIYSIFDEADTDSTIELLAHYKFRRELVVTGKTITNLGKCDRLSSDEALTSLEANIDKLLSTTASNEKLDLVDKSCDRITEYINRGLSKGIDTGFTQLNRLIGGFKPGKVYILGARTGMGKTNLSVFFSRQIARLHPSKYPVLFLSAEMSLESLGIRFIANLSGVNSSFISNNRMSYEEQDRFRIGLEEYRNLNLIIDEVSAQSLDSKAIALKVRSLHKTFGGVGAVVIDYVQLLGSYTINRRDLAIGEIIRTCKDLAKKFKVPFLVLAQVRREVENRQDKRPGLSDLKDSGTLEQAADLIMFLYRDEYYYQQNSMAGGISELIIAKNRDGGTGRIELEHDLGTCNYVEIVPKPRLTASP